MVKSGIYRYVWDHYRQPVQLETPATMSAWDHRFPRFCVRYTGWISGREIDTQTPYVAEPVIAARMADILTAENPGWWIRIADLGSAQHPALDEGTKFTTRDGHRGVITIRTRYGAAVHWHNYPGGPVTYPLDGMHPITEGVRLPS